MKLNDVLQWVGAVFIIVGHVLNTLGVGYHNDIWNIVAFSIGTIAFMTWAIRVKNKPQFIVNAVSIITCSIGVVIYIERIFVK